MVPIRIAFCRDIKPPIHGFLAANSAFCRVQTPS